MTTRHKTLIKNELTLSE